MKKRIIKRIALSITVFLLVYIGSYVFMSMRGTYRIEGHGLHTHYGFHWTPVGFRKKSNEMNTLFIYFYLPLIGLDRHFWHKVTWFPPVPPPFTQDGITIVPPLYYDPPAKWVDKGDKTQIDMKATDAAGNQFTIILFRSKRGVIPRAPIYCFPNDDGSRKIEIEDQAKFYARVYDFIEDRPEPESALDSAPAAEDGQRVHCK